MSKQLRDAYSVWTEAFGAWNNNPESVGASEDAAAIIEADRQATRAALVAEIVAWLRKEAPAALHDPRMVGDVIEAKWGQ